MAVFERGSIVWVELTDPQGRNPKCRPAVIVSATEEICPEAPVRVIGISTQVDQCDPNLSVKLPWARSRHPKTGLKEPCVAFCEWLKSVKYSDIKEQAGKVPGKELLQILNILQSMSGP